MCPLFCIRDEQGQAQITSRTLPGHLTSLLTQLRLDRLLVQELFKRLWNTLRRELAGAGGCLQVAPSKTTHAVQRGFEFDKPGKRRLGIRTKQVAQALVAEVGPVTLMPPRQPALA